MRPSRPVSATKSPIAVRVKSTSLANRDRIRSVVAEGAAIGPDDRFAIERDLAVVVSDHHQPAVAVGLEPRQKLVAMVVRIAVAVVGVEEDDPLHEVGDGIARVDESEEKARRRRCAGERGPLT